MSRTWTTIGVALAVTAVSAQVGTSRPAQPDLGVRSAPVLTENGLRFKDLDRDGRLTPYEDWRLSPTARATDLAGRMTLAEKAGVMVHGTIPAVGNPIGIGTRYDRAAATALIQKGVNTFITRLAGDPGVLASENNALQEIAERTRLGVPLVVSSDPRNHFQETSGASVAAGSFSLWPEALGFAAIGDAALVRRFADIARQEYRAVGIYEALSPQADLATEPRWPRISGTFGEDAALARRLVQAYVQGFQGAPTGLARNGVITVVKHWVGYGAAKDGFDSHNRYGRFASFVDHDLAYHIEPFKGAFAAGVAGVMPTYSILEGATLDGKPLEQVGGGFNAQLLTDLLRRQMGFKGVVLSDWAITNDCPSACQGDWSAGKAPVIGMSWGVEDLSRSERFAKAITAGVDQVGGTEESEQIVDAVKAGRLTDIRVTEAVVRVLTQKFELGLFEDPYVDAERARQVVGLPASQAAADEAQRRSLVLLENRNRVLPLKAGARVYLNGVGTDAARAHGLVIVSTPQQADVAVFRTKAPFQVLHPAYFFGAMQHEGDLDFKDEDPAYQAIIAASGTTPTVVTVFLDRPAILTKLQPRVAALLGNFGVSDDALLDVLTGKARPQGKLPFELPSSMDEVRAQHSDRQHDTAHPLYPIFFGRSY
jgi:beta-glucosidase